MKKLAVIFAMLLLLFAIGCSNSGSNTITGSDSDQTIQQNDNLKPPAPGSGDPDDIIDGNKGGG